MKETLNSTLTERPRMYSPSWAEICRDAYWLSIPDVETPLFESMWPLPEGINYNAYLVKGGDQYLLVDSARNILQLEQLVDLIKGVVEPGRIKDVVVLHAEPDHSGLMKGISSVLPNAAFHSTSRASSFMKKMFNVDTRVMKDGESLKVGDRTLRAIELPWIHWPDSMFLYLEGDGVLFTSDAFGAFGALQKPLFDDEVDFESYMRQAKEYFSTIVAGHRKMVLRDLEKVSGLGLGVKMIAPAHGIVLRSRIREFTQALRSWCTLEKKRKITVVYGSMYGLTERLAGFVSGVLKEESVEVNLYNVVRDEINQVLSSMVDSAGAIFVAPTYESNLFPPMGNLLDLLRVKRLGEGKCAGALVTKLWGGSAAGQLTSGLKESGYTIFEPVGEYLNYPSEQELQGIREFMLRFCRQALTSL